MSLQKLRDPASQAIVDLRSSLGVTQPRFAMMIGISHVSLARYETSRPPHGELLLKLADVAHDAGQLAVRDRLAELFLSEAKDQYFAAVARWRPLTVNEVRDREDVNEMQRADS